MKKTSAKTILVTVCVAQFLLPFMMAGISAALPPIGQDTGASAKQLSLITTYYALGLAIFQLLTGRMGDIWGRRRVFLWGMGVFTVTSFMLGLTYDINLIHFLRFLQGGSAAVYTASSLAILTVAAPEGRRGQYIGYSATAIYAGIACGPPVAGFIAGTLGWEWVYWVNGIGAAFAWLLMVMFVHTEWYEGKGEPFDWIGALLYSAGMGTMVIGSTLVQNATLNGALLLLLGLILLISYFRLEKKAKYPIFDMNLLSSNRVFTLSCLAAFVNYCGTFGIIFYLSLYLQGVRGMDVKEAGLYLALQFIVQTITTPFVSKLSDKFGAGRISAVGIAICGLGLCACAMLGRDSHMGIFMLAQVVLGLGVSLFAAPNTTVIMESVDKAHVGQAAGIVGTMRTSGALVNSTIMSITLGYFLGGAPIKAENIDAFLMSMRIDLILFGLFNLAAIGCALGRQKSIQDK